MSTRQKCLYSAKIWLALILLLSFCLRAAYISIRHFEVIGDAKGYDTIAWNMVQGYGFSIIPNEPTPARPPGYPAFLSVIYKMFGHNRIAARNIQLIIDVFTCFLIYLIAKETFGKKAGLLSAGMAALYPGFIGLMNMLYSETLFTFLLMIFLWFFIKAFKSRAINYYFYSGICAGLTTLTRTVTLLMPGFVLAGLLIVYKNKIKAVLHSLVFAIAMMIVILPWIIRNYVQFNLMSLSTGGGVVLWMQSYVPWNGQSRSFNSEPLKTMAKTLSNLELDRQLTREAIENIKKYPGHYLWYCVRDLYYTWVYSVNGDMMGFGNTTRAKLFKEGKYIQGVFKFSLALLHVFIEGLCVLAFIIGRKKWEEWFPLFLFILYFAAVFFPIEGIPRYVVPVFPVVIIMASYTLVYFSDKLKKTLSISASSPPIME